jgi:hypothetical protein
MSELRWAYPLLSTISLLSFLDIFLMAGDVGRDVATAGGGDDMVSVV